METASSQGHNMNEICKRCCIKKNIQNSIKNFFFAKNGRLGR